MKRAPAGAPSSSLRHEIASSIVACAAIVPAAGGSRRMGRPKLLLPYRGGTVLGATLSALRAAGVTPIAVVAADGDAPMLAWCKDAAADAAAGAGALVVTLNPAPERGMLSSILEGLAALGGASELAGRGAPVLVCPGDLPALRAATVAELLRRRQAAGAGLAVPAWRGKRGHPLAIAPALIPEIPRLDPGRGLRQLLDLHPGDLLSVEVDDPGCVGDLDTPEDYQRLVAGEGGQPAG
jgi:molybdenum cofactor cytidylyltransferase